MTTPLISIKDRNRMRGELERWDVPHEWVVVEGGKHSFMNHTLPRPTTKSAASAPGRCSTGS